MRRAERPERLSLNLTRPERDSLNAAAEVLGWTAQDYCRKRIFGRAPEPPEPEPCAGYTARSTRFQLCLSADEYDAIVLTAARYGLSASEYARARLLRRPAPAHLPVEE